MHLKIPQKWRELLALLPGYDSIATAPEGYWFDVEAAETAIAFFETYLTHTEGKGFAGKPFVLQPWQKALIGAVFGWKRPDGLRRYRRFFLYVPRKNGKSTLCAGIVNLLAYLDGEPGARIFSIAESRSQASLVFDHARNQILNNQELLALLPRGEQSIHRSYKSIEYADAIFRSLPSDAKNQHGLNPSAVIVDELHAHRNREMLDVMTTAVGARDQPLIGIITTADFDRPSICNLTHKYACDVRDGITDDPEFLPVIYEASQDDDWESPETWKKANPNWNVSVKPEFLEAECRRARNDPTYENTFRRLHLNQKTEQDQRLIPIEHWDAGKADIRIEDYFGRTCYGGIDLGATSDFSAFVLAFPEADEVMTIFAWFWLPDEPRRRDQRMTDTIDIWTSQKLITRTPGNVVDIGFVVDEIAAICRDFDVRELAADPHLALHGMQLLQQQGFEVIEFRQGSLSMTFPTKRFMDLIVSEKIRHDGNAVLRWMALNAAGARDSKDNLFISKAKSTEKIDGIIASVMAIGRATIHEMGGDGGTITDVSQVILN